MAACQKSDCSERASVFTSLYPSVLPSGSRATLAAETQSPTWPLHPRLYVPECRHAHASKSNVRLTYIVTILVRIPRRHWSERAAVFESNMTAIVHRPGEVLAQRLEALGVLPTELARQLGVPANRITQIIKGKRGITGDSALRLAHWFGDTPQFWMNLQVQCELELA